MLIRYRWLVNSLKENITRFCFLHALHGDICSNLEIIPCRFDQFVCKTVWISFQWIKYISLCESEKREHFDLSLDFLLPKCGIFCSCIYFIAKCKFEFPADYSSCSLITSKCSRFFDSHSKTRIHQGNHT